MHGTTLENTQLIIVQCLNWNEDVIDLVQSRIDLIIVQCLNWNLVSAYTAASPWTLIIVQCLNWNPFLNIIASLIDPSYNRTMLELKFNQPQFIRCLYTTYNRTMLELKFRPRWYDLGQKSLIIVQCLNWNWTL